MSQILKRAKGWLSRRILQHKIAGLRKKVHAEAVTILSQNCIGGVFYHDMGMQFLSPTINTFIPEPGYLRMVLNLREYMAMEPEIHWGEEYPIGMLGDVQIHFMHYKTCQEARESWLRRVKRINYDKILVLCTDRDGFDDEAYALWKQIPYPKVLFTAHPEYTEDAVHFPEFSGAVGDLISGRKFYRDGMLISASNRLK